MGEFAEKFLLAIIAFLLGLTSEVIKKQFQKEKKRLTYSLITKPIIAVSLQLPKQIRELLSINKPENITYFHIYGENTGSTLIKDANIQIILENETEVLESNISTNPIRGVKFSPIVVKNSNELVCTDIELERKQKIMINLFVRSVNEPSIKIFWSGGGGGVQWISKTEISNSSLESNLVAVIRNLIFANFTPSILNVIAFLVNAITNNIDVIDVVRSGSVAIITLIASLLQFYFYLRIIPHAIVVVRELIQRRDVTKTLNENS